MMDTLAVVLEEPRQIVLSRLNLPEPSDGEVLVDIDWTGISTGTERLLYTGRMPQFPGLGYPLVPGYESVGQVRATGAGSNLKVGDRVFVPGAKCFDNVHSLFGAAASRLVVSGDRAIAIDEDLEEKGVLIALAATAYHALGGGRQALPDLIVGHGVLGRLLARIAIALGGQPPTVWEQDVGRSEGAAGYEVLSPSKDERRDYTAIYDVSGDHSILDQLIERLAPSGEIVLAGFYDLPLAFSFPPAFMREARFRIAAEWTSDDLSAVAKLIESDGALLDGLITHERSAIEAPEAYLTAFQDPACLKMILDWRYLT